MTGNEPAIPCEIGGVDENGFYSGRQTTNCSGIAIGLTKREHFSIMAMQGFIANPKFCEGQEDAVLIHVAAGLAIRAADDLIEKLNEKESA